MLILYRSQRSPRTDLVLAIYRAGNFSEAASLAPITRVNDLALKGSRPFSGILWNETFERLPSPCPHQDAIYQERIVAVLKQMFAIRDSKIIIKDNDAPLSHLESSLSAWKRSDYRRRLRMKGIQKHPLIVPRRWEPSVYWSPEPRGM